MNIALGRYDGLLMFDHSFISIYQNYKCRHPSQEKLELEPSDLAKFIVIGKKKDEFFKGKESLTLQDRTFNIEVKENEPYLEVYCKPENATALLTLINTTAKGHIGGLEVWNLHRCALGRLTFPNDFPETSAGNLMVKNELERMNAKSARTPKVIFIFFLFSQIHRVFDSAASVFDDISISEMNSSGTYSYEM